MSRAIRSLALGLFFTSVIVSLISVYVFHDVDHDNVGHWDRAFLELIPEILLFTILICIPVWLLCSLGRRLLDLRADSPRASLALYLGTAVTIFQYPSEFVVRKFHPNLSERYLSFYLLAAIVICTSSLLYDNFRQAKFRKALEPPSFPA